MTAQCYSLNHAVLGWVANRILNECRGVNRVHYNMMSKPPGSLE